jgi:hypothetical protein
MKGLHGLKTVVAAALLWSATASASAQTSAGTWEDPVQSPNILNIASRENDCPVEPHPKAIDPVIVECHAKFAPLPVVPRFMDETTSEQRFAHGDWLVEQLNQPDVCGEGAKVSRHEACAILIYVLDPGHRMIGAPRAANYDGPWTHVVRIFRISHTTNPRDATIEVVTASDAEDYFGTGRKPVWTLLAEQRTAEECRRVKSKAYTRDNGSGAELPDSCRRTEGEDPRFYPTLLLPLSKARLVLSEEAVDWHFRAPVYYTN